MIEWGREKAPDCKESHVLRRLGVSVLAQRLLDGANPFDVCEKMLAELYELGLDLQTIPKAKSITISMRIE